MSEIASIAQANGLHRIGARPHLWPYLKSAWERRDFISTMARFKIRSRLERNRLGVIWLIITPVLDAIFYGVIFALLMGRDRPGGYGAFVMIGVFIFHFFTGCLTHGAVSITGHRSMVQTLSFPRITLPFEQVVEEFFSCLPSWILLVVALPIFGHMPNVRWLLIIPLMVFFTLFNTGITLLVARLTVHIRDLTQFLPFISRVLFFSSGVLFDVDKLFASYPWVITIYDFYPPYQVLELARNIFMGDEIRPIDNLYWIVLPIAAVITFIGGLLFFWVAEERYGRD
ncbi:MAG: ABC transporter permease [Propionibacteriaceae bacterium]|jgi:teichoic acid transport system permease protein|nr:ABC transporter permease [Propionibacteriaceae bacterium]